MGIMALWQTPGSDIARPSGLWAQGRLDSFGHKVLCIRCISLSTLSAAVLIISVVSSTLLLGHRVSQGLAAWGSARVAVPRASASMAAAVEPVGATRTSACVPCQRRLGLQLRRAHPQQRLELMLTRVHRQRPPQLLHRRVRVRQQFPPPSRQSWFLSV